MLSVIFNAIDLGSLTNTLINKIDIHPRPNFKVLSYKLARQDGSKLVNAEYVDKQVNIEGYIAATDRSTYEANRDTLMQYLQGQEGTLQITQSGATRLYTATVQDITWSMNEGGLGVFNIIFYCSVPFGQDLTPTTLLNAVTITAASSTQTFTAIDGSFKAFPKITILINSLTGGSNKYIKITNPADSKVITVTRNWSIGETLVIDCLAKTVTVAGANVDYTGVFPSWLVGATQLQYDDNLTTKNISLTFSYSRRFI